MEKQDCALCNAVKLWAKQPFRSDASALNWFLTFGLILAAVYFWSRVLQRIG